MRRLLASLTVLSLVVAGPVRSSFAHGAACMMPPHFAEPPTDPAPPAPPSDPGAPTIGGGGDGGGSPSTGGGRGGGPSTGGGGGGGPSTGGGAPTGGPTTGGGASGKKAKGVGGDSWTKWWDCNKHELLPVKAAVREMQRGPASRGLGGATGRTPTDAAVEERIVPLLKSLLVDPKQSYHVRSAAEIGLAKIGDADSVMLIEMTALNVSKDLHREVEESGALALGLMERDDAEIREVLVGLLRAPSRPNTYVRPFAAVALGLLGTKSDPERIAQNALLETLLKKEDGRDVKPACLMGLGLLGDEAAVPEIVSLLRASRSATPPLTDVETAFAVAALGKIGRPGAGKAGDETCALDEIVRRLDARAGSTADVRRAGVVALGQIGPACAPATQKNLATALETFAVNSIDAQERHYALIALGRVGGAKGADAVLRQRIGKFLVKELDEKSAQTPAFAAMALGLLGRGIVADGGAAPEEDVRAPLRAKFDEGGDPEIRGAYALASGLVHDALAADALLAVLSDKGADKRVRGWSALSLGLIGAREAAPAVRAALSETDRDLRFHAAMAAGLLRDPSAIPDVVAVLSDKDASNYELGSALLALGHFGDERAIDALIEIASDTKGRWRPETRSVAVVALGRIGDRRDIPTMARITADADYRTSVPAIAELLGIL